MAASGRWGRITSQAAFWLALGAVVLALGGALGAGQDLFDKLNGLAALRYAVFVAGAAIVVAIVALIIHLRAKSGRPLLIVLALLIAGAYLGYVGQQIRIARSVPAIHDATTDLADPPTFLTLKLRADNLAVVSDGARAELKALEPAARWRALHGEAYGDLRPLRVDLPVAETVALAESVARGRGWTVADSDPEGGRLEATDSVSLFRFKDDVVVRVRRDGGGSVVDVRSVSRIGVSDLGVNARRVRGFLTDLKARAGNKAR